MYDISKSGIIEVDRRCQVVTGHEKTFVEFPTKHGRFRVEPEVRGRAVHSWYSHGWYFGELTGTFFAARSFDRFETIERTYFVLCETGINELRNKLIPWVRDMTRASKGRWSVAADKNKPWPPKDIDEPMPVEFSFETKEDAVKFKVFARV